MASVYPSFGEAEKEKVQREKENNTADTEEWMWQRETNTQIPDSDSRSFLRTVHALRVHSVSGKF